MQSTPKKKQSPKSLAGFCSHIWNEGARLYRDLPWRRTTNPYEVFVSEVMLQQTQVSRVEKHWVPWLDRFPEVEILAEAPLDAVLSAWQGMGYNRRAVALHKAAKMITTNYGGRFPQTEAELIRLPGVGYATAAGLLAFAFNKPVVYLETNVRTVFLHELFPHAVAVPDKELVPLIEKTCPGADGKAYGEMDGPRAWYYALLDYGAYLKKTVPNPSRRSKTHTQQSSYEGSRRQKRAELIRLLLEAKVDNGATKLDTEALTSMLSFHEQKEGRPAVNVPLVQSILEDLEREGFCSSAEGCWWIPSSD